MDILNLITPSGVTLLVAYIVGIVALKLFVFSHTGNRASWLIFALFCVSYGGSTSNILVVFGCALAAILFVYLFLTTLAPEWSGVETRVVMYAFIIVIFEAMLVGGFSWVTSFRSFVHELSIVLLILGFVPLMSDAAKKPYHNSSGFIWMSLGASLLWLIGQALHPHIPAVAYLPPLVSTGCISVIIFLAERNSIYDPLQENPEKPTALDRLQADLYF